jgi:hypothetical protein
VNRCCTLCGDSNALVRGRNGGWYCHKVPDCNYRCRVKLGVSEGLARGLRAQEWREVIAQRHAR